MNSKGYTATGRRAEANVRITGMCSVNRPEVILNYACTADGKISLADRSWHGFGSHRDKDRMDRLRSLVDVVLIGAETLRREDPDLRIVDAARRQARIERGQPENPRPAILSRSLKLPQQPRMLSHFAEKPWLITATADKKTENKLSKSFDVLATGGQEVDLQAAMSRLWEEGVVRLLVEGGGATNALFVESGMVDEIYMTICPVLAGGVQAPTPVDGKGLNAGTLSRLRLMETYQGGDEVFCRYQVMPAAAKAD